MAWSCSVSANQQALVMLKALRPALDEVKVWLVKMLPIVDPEGFFLLTGH